MYLLYSIAMLLVFVAASPFFLYRTEIGPSPEASTFQLTDYELASLLSFSLLNAPPPEPTNTPVESAKRVAASSSIDARQAGRPLCSIARSAA